jgi:hypothetical protein
MNSSGLSKAVAVVNVVMTRLRFYDTEFLMILVVRISNLLHACHYIRWHDNVFH